MPTYPLSESIAVGDPGHAAKHNEERDGINDLWERLGQDTGWRNVAGTALAPAWELDTSLGICHVRRVGPAVWVRAKLQRVTTGGNRADEHLVITLPTGFRHYSEPALAPALLYTGAKESGLVMGSGVDPAALLIGYFSGGGTWAGAGADHISFTAKFLTPDVHPTVLPGVPA